MKRMSLLLIVSMVIITACDLNKPNNKTFPVITRENVGSLTQVSSYVNKWIAEMAWMSDGLSIAACCDVSGQIFIIDSQTLEANKMNISQKYYSHHLAVSPIDNLVAIITGEFQHVEIWKVEPQDLLMTLGDSENEFIEVVSFSPDGKLIATGGWDYQGIYNPTVILWDLTTGERVKEINLVTVGVAPGWDQFIKNLAFSPDGKLLAALAWDRSVHLWNIKKGSIEMILPKEEGDIQHSALTFSPKGDLLAVGNGPFTNNLRIIDINSGEIVFNLKKPKGVVRSVSFNADGTLIAACLNSAVHLWDIESGDLLTVLDTPPISSIAFNQEGTLLATTGRSDGLYLWGLPAP